ncbi:TRAP transporter small permease subunit [Sphingomonas sp. SUN039]|uniref:TRAP transporter small permease subunit n=1 Tax=Sphingomonas sp. SUN039 TaxID=2937787 RepID=UPI0021645C0A|nr:TRAP transporter small permease subunit [Sphingomonas sp. SUN039]UVO54384.1 TRAP transporter small permease subunit [Sphingomonas sp. SUN039]
MARLNGLLTWIGGGALLLATATDAIAVIGRYIGVALHGSIEVVQAAVLVSGSVALIAATAARAHATVHLLTERMGPRLADVLARTTALLSAAFFVALLAGGVWLSADLWQAREASELLAIPYAPLRIVANLAVACVALLFLRDVMGRRT